MVIYLTPEEARRMKSQAKYGQPMLVAVFPEPKMDQIPFLVKLEERDEKTIAIVREHEIQLERRRLEHPEPFDEVGFRLW